MKIPFAFKSIFTALALALAAQAAFGQGSLTPPSGPITPTGKSLDQIQPRKPISSLPFIITQPGSYYVTTNLTGLSGQPGITINADCVTVDLGGFCLMGNGGFVSGIVVPSARKNITVRNGTLRTWGNNGLDAYFARNSDHEHIRASNNGGNGLAIGPGSTARHCHAESNLHGIYLSGGAVLQSSTATGNSQNGIYATAPTPGVLIKDCQVSGSGNVGILLQRRSTVEDCLVSENTLAGIQTADGATLVRCSVAASGSGFNFNAGINAGPGSTVKDCSVVSCGHTGLYAGEGSLVSGCTARTNVGAGILVARSSTVERCVASGNGAGGIQVDSQTRVVDNHCSHNGVGLHVTGDDNRIDGNSFTGNTDQGVRVDGGYNLILRNSATVNHPDFEINGANNRTAPIVGDLASPHPFANFAY